jgi:collagen type I/II/III/V/XI/XXIV/XXVII alpha
MDLLRFLRPRGKATPTGSAETTGPAVERPLFDWATVASIQRVLAPTRSIATAQPRPAFATHADPRMSESEMAHNRDGAAPGGIVHGFLTSRVGRPQLLDLPALPLPVRGSTDEAAPPPDQPVTPVVQRSATSGRLVSAPRPAVPTRVLTAQRPGAGQEAAPRSTDATPVQSVQRAPAPGTRTAAPAPPEAQRPARTRRAVPAQPLPASDVAHHPVPPRRPVQRRSRLGPPLPTDTHPAGSRNTTSEVPGRAAPPPSSPTRSEAAPADRSDPSGRGSAHRSRLGPPITHSSPNVTTAVSVPPAAGVVRGSGPAAIQRRSTEERRSTEDGRHRPEGAQPGSRQPDAAGAEPLQRETTASTPHVGVREPRNGGATAGTEPALSPGDHTRHGRSGHPTDTGTSAGSSRGDATRPAPVQRRPDRATTAATPTSPPTPTAPPGPDSDRPGPGSDNVAIRPATVTTPGTPAEQPEPTDAPRPVPVSREPISTHIPVSPPAGPITEFGRTDATDSVTAQRRSRGGAHTPKTATEPAADRGSGGTPSTGTPSTGTPSTGKPGTDTTASVSSGTPGPVTDPGSGMPGPVTLQRYRDRQPGPPPITSAQAPIDRPTNPPVPGNEHPTGTPPTSPPAVGSAGPDRPGTSGPVTLQRRPAGPGRAADTSPVGPPPETATDPTAGRGRTDAPGGPPARPAAAPTAETGVPTNTASSPAAPAVSDTPAALQRRPGTTPAHTSPTPPAPSTVPAIGAAPSIGTPPHIGTSPTSPTTSTGRPDTTPTDSARRTTRITPAPAATGPAPAPMSSSRTADHVVPSPAETGESVTPAPLQRRPGTPQHHPATPPAVTGHPTSRPPARTRKPVSSLVVLQQRPRAAARSKPRPAPSGEALARSESGARAAVLGRRPTPLTGSVEPGSGPLPMHDSRPAPTVRHSATSVAPPDGRTVQRSSAPAAARAAGVPPTAAGRSRSRPVVAIRPRPAAGTPVAPSQRARSAPAPAGTAAVPLQRDTAAPPAVPLAVRPPDGVAPAPHGSEAAATNPAEGTIQRDTAPRPGPRRPAGTPAPTGPASAGPALGPGPSVQQRRSAPPPSAAVPAPPTGSSSVAVGGATVQRTSGVTRRTERVPDSTVDIDDLARRLLAPLSRLLRAELRMERERSGRLRDARQ